MHLAVRCIPLSFPSLLPLQLIVAKLPQKWISFCLSPCGEWAYPINRPHEFASTQQWKYKHIIRRV
jgi:hypothetical protein